MNTLMKRLLATFLFCSLAWGLWAQSGIYIPSAKPIKNMQKAMADPDVFCLVLKYGGGDISYSTSDLDWLDSAYNVAFNRESQKLYSMTIEGYGGDNFDLTQARVDGVFQYYANRSHAPFPIRYAVNPIQCSCHGDTIELLRYEVPVDRRIYNCNELPESRKVLNKSINLDGCVMVTFRHNPDECIGMARGCIIPAQDSTVRGYYASVFMKKGSLYSVTNTKDTCPSDVQFYIEEHLDYKDVVERYFLIPHRKQILIQAGYVVIHSSLNRKYGECSKDLMDSIYVRFPVTQDQWDNKIRIIGKRYSEKGCEYKALTTKKIPSKVSINVQAALNPMQLDTIFLGKRIQPEELSDYFYEVKTDMEEGSFTVQGRHYKAYKMNKHGEYEIKKPLKALLRITEEADEEIEEQKSDRRYAGDEELE